MYRTVLVASDGSDDALRAARVASQIALAFKSRLIMLHVFEIPVVPVIGDSPGSWTAVPIEPPTKEAQDAVVSHTRSALDPGVEAEDRREFGYPAPTILREAEDQKADLIVVGCRGMGAVGRFLLGSVSDRVLHHAPCSVMIVK